MGTLEGFSNNIRQFFRIMDFRTLIVTLLAVVSTWLCRHFGLAANMPTGLIGIAIVFPIVFSINAAYRRREEALRYYASLKAHAVALCYAHRDWVKDSDTQDHFRRARDLLHDLLGAVETYFAGRSQDEGRNFSKVYDIFSRYSQSHEMLRQAGVPANEVSRANQYVRAMMIEFERMKNILLYRTPVSLRAYSFFFLKGFPILFGPYFAYLADSTSPFVGYAVAVMYSVVLVSLDNIQSDLENPFDLNGADDIKLDISDRYLSQLD